jgi:hypothetical protein
MAGKQKNESHTTVFLFLAQQTKTSNFEGRDRAYGARAGMGT